MLLVLVLLLLLLVVSHLILIQIIIDPMLQGSSNYLTHHTMLYETVDLLIYQVVPKKKFYK